MPKYELCIATIGKVVPASAEWFHEISAMDIASEWSATATASGSSPSAWTICQAS
jgi:hypothetical protein